ncbi:CFEM domain-containing protein [Coniochaeta sp. 2T2.1]|nr:CFEM domain-containing protein [Coniochaeta sp. 2T2.1]
MRSIVACLLFALLAVVQLAAAAENAAQPPSCGLNCIVKTVLSSSKCSLLDTDCICADAPLNDKITLCVQANCTIWEQLETKKYSTETCHINGEDRRALVRITAVVFGFLGLTAFALRCVARLYVAAQTWGIDDWIICAAVAVMVPLQVISIPLSNHGLGLDMWNVPHDSITTILYLYFWDEMVYVTALSLTKVSILFFYLKVFPGKRFRYVVYTLIAANICYAVVFDLLLAFQCHPIAGAWLSWDGTFHAKCISINILGWTAAAINIVLDLAVIILPLPELFRLSMSLRKKVQIIMMFAVGFFVTFVSIIRLRSLVEFGNTQNVTQDYVEVGYWSTIEVPVGIICACMPAVRSLFSLVFPKVFSTSRKGSNYGFGSVGPSLKLSSQPKLASNKQISIKQEWTVVSSDVGRERYPSDEELVRAPLDLDDQDAPARRVTLMKGPVRSNSHSHV